MEKAPNNESREIDIQEVLERLRATGPEDPETMELVLKWTQYQEELVRRVNTSKATMMFNILRSDVYLAAGDREGALECLEEARLQAHQENEETLYIMIMKKMDEIEG
ncbi:MAG: hypothetical protein ABL917_03515 [Parcubacteria group bacterium]